MWPTSGSGSGWAMDSLGAIRTTSTGNEGFSEGIHVDMDVRVAASPANRNIAVTGTATTAGLGGTYWRTLVFEQNSTGTTVAIKSGWPRDSTFSVQTPDMPEGVAIGTDNTVYVTGKTANPIGEEDPQIAYLTTIRYAAAGTSEIWTHHWDNSKQSHGMDIVLDKDGNAYATGFLGIATDIDYATVRIPKDWDENYGDTGLKTARWDNNERIDKAVSIDLTYEVESGVLKPYIYVTGSTTEVEDTSDIATIRYSPHTGTQSLTEVWDDIYGGSNGKDEVGLMVVGAGNGNAYVIGRKATENVGPDYVLLGYRKAGSMRISAQTYNGTGNDFDEGRALAMAGAGHVRATGQSTGSGGTLLDFATVEHAQSVSSGGPSEDEIYLGSDTGGDLADLVSSNNEYRVYTRTNDDVDTPEKLIVEFYATSPISSGSNPSEICIRYEGKCSVSNVMLRVEIFNWVTTSYDQLDYRKATTSDSKLVFVIKEDPDLYILGVDPEIKLRLSWDASLGGETYDWTASIDQLSFELIGS